MATVADVTPVESRRLIPNRGRFTPFVEVGRAPGGWCWRLRFTFLTTHTPTHWSDPFPTKGEALAAGIVGFNLSVQRIDGADGQQYQAACDPVEVVRESVEK